MADGFPVWLGTGVGLSFLAMNKFGANSLAVQAIVIAEPHGANRIVVGRLVEAFLFEFEADHRRLRLVGQAVIAECRQPAGGWGSEP
jgi:hypothetical protein